MGSDSDDRTRPEGTVPSGRVRVLLKLSGEALAARDGQAAYDVSSVTALLDELAACVEDGIELAIVVGGGNVFRGAELRGAPVLRDSADRMGMLATLMNGLALRDLIRSRGLGCDLLTGLAAPEVAATFTRERATTTLAAGHVLVLAGGTGEPYFTTDTAAVLRALQIDADRLLKATKVDGIYSADPQSDPTAERFDEITFQECLERSLAVMDQTAFALARDNGLEIVVFDMRGAGQIRAAARGASIGTRVVLS